MTYLPRKDGGGQYLELTRKGRKLSNSNIEARNLKQYQMTKTQNYKQKIKKQISFEHFFI